MNLPEIKKSKNLDKKGFLKTGAPKRLIVLNALVSIGYFTILAFFFERGNFIIYWALILGAVFYLWQVLTFLFTVWDTNYKHQKNDAFKPWVDVFITVAGEPLDIVEETVRAARDMDYPNFNVFILNDGFVAQKDNWREVELLAKRLGVRCITRRIAGGAKAGNINHALKLTGSPFIAVFDSDYAPHKDFLSKTAGYFFDPLMGFVQTPQFYRNQKLNDVTSGAWDQQMLYYGAILKGKNRLNSVSMCGTNMVIRRKILEEVGGMCEKSIAEDFITGLYIHERGYKSVYVPEVLAEGLAPEDFLSYYKQQFRWARGSMDIIFRHNLFAKSKLTLSQKIQYLASVSFFLSGAVVVINALIPVMFFFTGWVPFSISTMELALIFLPYIFLTLYTLQVSCNYSFSWRALAFCMASFPIHIKALVFAVLGKSNSFFITSKRQVSGNFLYLVYPHIAYLLMVAAGILVAVLREGIDPSVISNIAWAFINVSIFWEFIRVASPEPMAVKARRPLTASIARTSELQTDRVN